MQWNVAATQGGSNGHETAGSTARGRSVALSGWQQPQPRWKVGELARATGSQWERCTITTNGTEDSPLVATFE
jgi:hypothetical protein